MADKLEEKGNTPTRNPADDVLEQMEKARTHGSNGSETDEQAAEKPAPQQGNPQDGGEKKPSKVKQLWEKTGLDTMTLKMMFKASLPPTIAIAMFQSHTFAAHYTTLGYLVAIASVLGFCIMPRGKFIQQMSLNVFGICLGAALNLLALYCGVKARQHTSPPTPPASGSAGSSAAASVPYNAAQSAVLAIWLIFQVFIVSVVRASRPQYQFPAILCTIFTIVSMSYGVLFPTMTAAISFMERLLEAFLTGFGLATATHFLVFPTSSRLVVCKEMTGYLKLLNGVLMCHTGYMASLETFDPLASKTNGTNDAGNRDDKDVKKKAKKAKDPHADDIMVTTAGKKLRETMDKLLELHAKLHADITPAKREFAIGKLESHDFTVLWKLMRQVFLPVIGLSSLINILERQARDFGWDKKEDEVTEEEDHLRHDRLDNLHFIMKHLHKPFAEMMGTLNGGFQHVLLVLEFDKPEKKKQPDEESKGDEPAKPGTTGFAETFRQKVDNFYDSKQKTLQEWCHQHGIELPPNFFDSSFVYPEDISPDNESIRERRQRQLFFVLYLEYLLYRCSKAMLELVLYVDKRKQDGVFKRKKFIFPGSKTMYKYIRATFGEEDISHEDSFTVQMESGNAQSLYLGQQFDKLKDPEHLPPQNSWEKFGEKVRGIPKFFRSDASAFGLRVVAATMSIGVVAYLRDTQAFFLRNRFLWSLIMVTMSMQSLAGQSVFQFVLRVAGTAVATIGAFIVWYIVDGHTAGVIVFLWLWIFCAFYVVLKMPKFVIVGILSLVTVILIIGYELQVRVLGVAVSTSNGQPAYPLYILAPYRLAAVTVGIVVAFIWTIFPFPLSESTALRKDLAASMKILSAFYENVHETVQARINGSAGNEDRKGTHAYNLDKARHILFNRLVLLLNNLKTNAEFSKFQLRVGGKFPREEYEALITTMRRLTLWTSLASYSSVSFHDGEDSETSPWSSTFRKVLANTNNTSHTITSLLTILSSSLNAGTPLPPYIQMPEPFHFLRRVNEVDRDILSVRHIAEPEYSAFAVMQIVSRLIHGDIIELRKHVNNLVGEIDFSFRAVQSSSMSTSTYSVDSEDKDKGD